MTRWRQPKPLRRHTELRHVHQHDHQFSDRGVRDFPVGALGKSVGAEASAAPAASHDQGLSAVRHADSRGREEVRALHQRGLKRISELRT